MSLLTMGVSENKRWFYPISGFFITICTGVGFIWNMLLPYISTNFGGDAVVTRASLMVATSFLGIGSMIVGPPITGFILDKKGPKIPLAISGALILSGLLILVKMLTISDWGSAKILFYLASAVVGIGWGMWNGALATVVARWFPDKLGTAMGIAVAGGSASIMLLAPLVTRLIAAIGFSGNLFVVIGVFGFIILYGFGVLLYKVPATDWLPADYQPPVTAEGTVKVEKHFTLEEAVRDKRFWFLYGGMLCSAFGFMIYLQNVAFILMEGLSKGGMAMDNILGSVVPLFLSVTALGGLLGNLAWGRIMDKLGSPFKALTLVYSISGIIMWVFYMGYTSVPFILVSAFVFHFAFGGEPPLHYAAAPFVFGRKHTGKIMNILNASSVGLGIALGPYVGGKIFDIFGSYLWAMVLAVLLRLIASGFAFMGGSYHQKIESQGSQDRTA